MRRPVLTLLLLSLLTFFVGLGGPAITDSDEAYYAEASREMADSGDWLTPTFNFEYRWQKPVLYYWLTAATYLVTGPTEWSARLWSALSGVGLVLVTRAAARTITGRADTGWLAGVIVATCFGYFAMARASLPDLPLTLCITLAIWAAMKAVDAGVGWWAVAGLGAGLGFLLKGPVALVIPGLVLLPIAWRERTRITIRPAGVALAAAVCALVGLPWYLAMFAEHGTAYTRSFFIGDNLERFATDRFNDPRPVWFYLPVLLGGMLPWSAYLALSMKPLAGILRGRRRLTDPEWRLLLWALMPLVFYTLSMGKQPRYILPVLPPLAILLACAIGDRTAEASLAGRRQPGLLWATWATALLFGLATLALARMQPLLIDVPASVAWAGLVAMGLAAAALAVVAARRAWGALPVAIAGSAVVMLLTVQFVVFGRPRPEPVERMADQVLQHRGPEDHVGVYRAFVRNLVFYTGVRQEDLFDEARAVDFVKSPERVLLVLPAADLKALEAASGVSLRTLAEVTYVNTANIRLRTLLRANPSDDVVRVLLVVNR